MTTFQARDELRDLLDRIEEMEIKKRLLAEDIADTYREAKAAGFDAKAMKTIMAGRIKRTPFIAEPGSVLAMYVEALDAPAPTS